MAGAWTLSPILMLAMLALLVGVAASTAFVTARVIARRAFREQINVSFDNWLDQTVAKATQHAGAEGVRPGAAPPGIFVVGSNITIITHAPHGGHTPHSASSTSAQQDMGMPRSRPMPSAEPAHNAG